MKQLVIIFLGFGLLCIAHQQVHAQYCDGTRFLDNAYASGVTVTTNVTYGNNQGVGTGTNQSLEFDLYEPVGDTSTPMRPLIIFAHGGSFIGGSKGDVAFLCNIFARMGYVTATIEYRVGFFFPVNEVSTTLAVFRAAHDMKAAVRFFRKDAATDNKYRIDPDNIIVGGVSAGAIAAIHSEYFDDINEVPSYMANDTAGLGGIEGNSGNLGYSSKAAAVINFSGAIGDTAWINQGDAPITSFHNEADGIVPFDTREVSVNGFPTGLIGSGSGSIKQRVDRVSVVNDLEVYAGSGHVTYLNGGAVQAAAIDSVKVFLYNNVLCKNATAINDDHNGFDVKVYPNPTSGTFVVDYFGTGENLDLEVYNSLAQSVHVQQGIAGNTTIDLSHLQRGLYFLSLVEKDKSSRHYTYKLILE